MTRSFRILVVLILSWPTLFTYAQTPATRPADEVDDLLGSAFTSVAAGISFRPPANCVQYHGAGGDEIVQYLDEKREWVLKVGRVRVSEPLPLITYDRAGVPQKGLLDITLDQTRQTTPGAEILRSDVIPLPDCNAGMIVVRYTANAQRKLTQQAILQAHPAGDPRDPKAPPGSTLYYVFNFTTPGAGTRPEGKGGEDPREKLAVDVFRQVLDSVHLIDNENIRREQDARLFATRSLFVNWTPQFLESRLLAEQYLRIIRDGKDIGYIYIVEHPELRAQSPGVEVGMHSTTWPDKDSPGAAKTQADVESWMWSTADRKHESWSSVGLVVADDGRGKPDSVKRNQAQELGSADQRPETFYLTVKTVSSHGNAQPVNRELPPFYLPQAIGHLLPRLMPLREPKEYMFATWVGQQQEVMARYVDVEKEQEVTLAGQKYRAVPIRDRLGLEGSITVHYFTPYPRGEYLGSYSKDSGVTILPSDKETLLKLYPTARLTPPDKIIQNPAPFTPPAAEAPAPAAPVGRPASGRIPNRPAGSGR